MSKPTQSEMLEHGVLELKRQREELQARLQLLSAEQGEVDLSSGDAVAAVQKLQVDAVELQNVGVVLLALDKRIAGAAEALASARRAEAEQRCQPLLLQAGQQFKELVKQAQSLEKTLDDLDALRGKVYAEGGAWPITVPPSLTKGIRGALQHWRQFEPERLGLPPKPSLKQAAIADEKRRVERLRHNLDDMRNKRGVSDELLMQQVEGLHHSEDRLAALEAAA